jgi:hypothetical protein
VALARATRRTSRSTPCPGAEGTTWQLGQTQAATLEIRLDGGLVSPYDRHSGAPVSLGSAPSRSVQKILAMGLMRVQIVFTLRQRDRGTQQTRLP